MTDRDLALDIHEAGDALAAILDGEVDALVVASEHGQRVFRIEGADRLYRMLFEMLNEGALTIAADGTILFANRRLARMLRRPLGKVLGASFERFVSPADAGRFARTLAGAQEGAQQEKIALIAADGGAVPVMVSLSAPEDGVSAVVVTDLTAVEEAQRVLSSELEASVAARTRELSKANDALRAEIARREQIEGELRQMAHELTEASRRKDTLLSMLAHELRNPLAPILAAAEMIRHKAEANDPLQRYVAIIGRQVHVLARLVDDLVDVSYITRGTIRLRRESVEVSAVVRRAVESSRPLIDGAGHALQVLLPAEPLRVDVDPARFEQMLVNLLDNAAKYTPRCGRIVIAAKRSGGEAVVSVRDNGMGIAPDLLPSVFDLFVQGDRALDRAQGGLGLGLTRVKSLTEMHGGTVEAHSEGAGCGSEFVVRLPLAPASVPEEEPQAPDGDAGPAPRRRVLVVEDNEDAAAMVAEMLALWGYEVSQARDGEQALQLAATFRPEVVLLDIGLPGMDGYEVARQLRSAWGPGERPLVIGLTAYGEARDRAAAHASGFDQFLVKPASSEALRRLLDADGR